MEKPFLRMNPFGPKPGKSTKKMGYKISQSKEEIEMALNLAQNLVLLIKEEGKKICSWSLKATKDANQIFSRQKTQSKPKNQLTLDKRLWEIAFWENEISKEIRSYYEEISKALAELNQLNPPLDSKQIEPFLKEILVNRRETLQTLEPLTQCINSMNKLKTQFSTLVFRPISSKTDATASHRSK